FDNNRLVINGNDTDNSNNRTLFVNGSIGATSAFNNDSDRRLKENIQTIPNALDKVLQMRGVTYQWKDGRETGDRMGFIAQEVEPILPQVVDNKNDHYTMQYAPITAVLIEAVKGQQAEIEALKKANQKLENSNNELKAQVAKINELEAMLQQLQTQTSTNSNAE
ncbi:MAG: tail fiber domain-containing protein, partial [Saprospiraceae bacterium]